MKNNPPRARAPVMVIGWALAILAAAACGGNSSDQGPVPAETTAAEVSPTATSVASSTTTAAPQTTTVPETTTSAAPLDFKPTRLAYRYPADGQLEYAMTIEQQSVVEVDGGSADQRLPGAIETTAIIAGTISYRMSPGPEENTVSIRIVSDVQLVKSDSSMNGIPLPDQGIGDVTGFETPIDITVVVDEQGAVLEMSSAALDDLFGVGDSFLGSSMGNQQLNRPFGPAFPDREVDVGDSWTEEIIEDTPFGDPMVTNAVHRLVAVEGTDERPILVVESEYRTDPFQWDMTEMLSTMFGAFAEAPTGAESGPAEMIPSDMSMLIEINPGVMKSISRFDAGNGLVVEGWYRAPGQVITHMTLPDDAGEAGPVTTTVEYDQEISYELIGPVA